MAVVNKNFGINRFSKKKIEKFANKVVKLANRLDGQKKETSYQLAYENKDNLNWMLVFMEKAVPFYNSDKDIIIPSQKECFNKLQALKDECEEKLSADENTMIAFKFETKNILSKKAQRFF